MRRRWCIGGADACVSCSSSRCPAAAVGWCSDVVLSHASLGSDAGFAAHSGSEQGVGRVSEVQSACNGTVDLCLSDCHHESGAVACMSWLCRCCTWILWLAVATSTATECVGHPGAAYAVRCPLQRFSADCSGVVGLHSISSSARNCCTCLHSSSGGSHHRDCHSVRPPVVLCGGPHMCGY